MRGMACFVLLATLPATADISSLTWLSGCWTYDGKDTGSGEYWMPPVGGTMFAVSRTVREGRTVGFEYLRIVETGEQSLALFASPSGQSPVQFDLVSQTSSAIAFENPEHDFPQRILYSLTEDGSLLGRIEGQSDGRAVAVDFPMTRVDCEAFGS